MMVKNLIENEDGSATVEFDMTQQEAMQVMETALRIGLIRGLQLAEAEEMKGFKDERTDEAKRVTKWVGLTDEEIDSINYTSARMLAREVEDMLKEKNTCQD